MESKVKQSSKISTVRRKIKGFKNQKLSTHFVVVFQEIFYHLSNIKSIYKYIIYLKFLKYNSFPQEIKLDAQFHIRHCENCQTCLQTPRLITRIQINQFKTTSGKLVPKNVDSWHLAAQCVTMSSLRVTFEFCFYNFFFRGILHLMIFRGLLHHFMFFL